MAPSSFAAEANPRAAKAEVAFPPKIELADARAMHEVWDWNFDKEFEALVLAASSKGANVALDMEFPGFLCQEPRSGERDLRYQALRENVDRLRPIQFGAAVASAEGGLRGVWSFNLRFDVRIDLHCQRSVAFLRDAGIDFPRHATEGIEAARLGRRLADSCLVGQHGRTPWWITFSGAYDLGYLLKLLTTNQPLPLDADGFDTALSLYCPCRHELREHFPHGSLDILAQQHGVRRHGRAHTAGSDALLTLDLFLRVVDAKSRQCKDQWAAYEAWGGTLDSWAGYSDWDSADVWELNKWDSWSNYPSIHNQGFCMFWLPNSFASPPPWYMAAAHGWSLSNYAGVVARAAKSSGSSSTPSTRSGNVKVQGLESVVRI